MSETVRSNEYFISSEDGYKDRYLIEYPSNGVSDLLVLYLHSGLFHAEQAFCDKNAWCFGDLRDEVMHRRGVYVSPEYRGDSWLNAATEADLVKLINHIKEQLGVSKVILTGSSMGATAALVFASHHPELVNGVIALCPATDMRELYRDMKSRKGLLYNAIAKSISLAYGGTPEDIPHEYTFRSSIEHTTNLRMPVVLRHGVDDEILTPDHSRSLVSALKLQGTPVFYDEIPGGNHSSPTICTPWGDYFDFVLDSAQK